MVPSNFDDNLNSYDYNPTNCEILYITVRYHKYRTKCQGQARYFKVIGPLISRLLRQSVLITKIIEVQSLSQSALLWYLTLRTYIAMQQVSGFLVHTE